MSSANLLAKVDLPPPAFPKTATLHLTRSQTALTDKGNERRRRLSFITRITLPQSPRATSTPLPRRYKHRKSVEIQCNLNAEFVRMYVLVLRNECHDDRALGSLRPFLDHQEAINKCRYWKSFKAHPVD